MFLDFVTGMVESDVSEDDEGEFDTTFEQVTQPQVEYWISECVKYWQKHLAFGQGANIWLRPMCPTKVVGKKQQLIHHMVRHHRREATSVASNGSSKKRDIARLPFKKPGAKCRRKDLDLVHGTRNRKQRVHMKSKWNRRQIEGAVLELFHDKTIDTHWSDLQLSPSWEPQREAMERKCVRMEEDITILLDGKTMKYILRVEKQVHHKLGSTHYCMDAFLHERHNVSGNTSSYD